MAIKKVSVYCSSSNQINPVYFEATKILGETLVKNGVSVVFGGGAIGLMGHLADTVIENKGEMIGIMPHFMKEAEMQHKGVEQFHFVEDMATRKKMFLEGVDALITLPGGCGTFEEFFEAITLKRLGIFTKPIIIVNINNYYKPMIELLNQSVDEKFMREIHREMWTIIEDPAEIITAIEESTPWSAGHFKQATMK